MDTETHNEEIFLDIPIEIVETNHPPEIFLPPLEEMLLEQEKIKESALAKLTSFGLTEEEAKSIFGI